MRKREINDMKEFFEGNVTLPALTAGLNRICKSVGRNGLSKDTLEELHEDILKVAGHFGVSERAAVLLAHITEHSGGNGCDEDDLAQYVGCSNIEFIGFREDLSSLEKAGIILRGLSRGRRSSFIVSREAARSIETGEPYVAESWDGLTAAEVFTRFRIFFSDFQRDVIDPQRLLSNIRLLLEHNPTLVFSSKVMQSPVWNESPDTEQRIFFYLCHRLVTYGNRSVPVDRLLNMTDYMEDDRRLRRELANGETCLQWRGLVTFGGDGNWKDTDSLALSEEVVSTFLPEIKLLPEDEENRRNITRAADIPEKRLYYNDGVASQMDTLGSLLEQDNFLRVRERLSEMGMRKGFAVLFSGGAGCGKTAGVYELARRTGRDVFSVDMSELKSKWVGDSEKIVKGVFNAYSDMCRRSGKAPILLFNEADAIFSKRIENPEDSVDQMMNAIQNICLEAIENLDGILIATTNLAGNFCDEAFERRFLFKVDFTTPEPPVRARIWQSMIPELTEDDARTLGERYSFTGGNIENIARKAAVGYVLSGRKADLGTIIRYCEEELFSPRKRQRKIGF